MFHRRRMLAPIVSIKHYVHRSETNIASGNIVNLIVASAEQAPAVSNAFDVREGSVIKAIWVELWVIGQGPAGATAFYNMTIVKLPSDSPAMTFTNSANLGGYPNKKNIMYTTQAQIGSAANGPNPSNMFKGWIKVPKGKQRMGAGDKWVVNVASNAQTISICGLFTYKEYT